MVGGGVCELLVNNNTFSCNLCLDRMYKGRGGVGGQLYALCNCGRSRVKTPPLVLNAVNCIREKIAFSCHLICT